MHKKLAVHRATMMQKSMMAAFEAKGKDEGRMLGPQGALHVDKNFPTRR